MRHPNGLGVGASTIDFSGERAEPEYTQLAQHDVSQSQSDNGTLTMECNITGEPNKYLGIVATVRSHANELMCIKADLSLRNRKDDLHFSFERSFVLICQWPYPVDMRGREIPAPDKKIDYKFRLVMGDEEDRRQPAFELKRDHAVLFWDDMSSDVPLKSKGTIFTFQEFRVALKLVRPTSLLDLEMHNEYLGYEPKKPHMRYADVEICAYPVNAPILAATESSEGDIADPVHLYVFRFCQPSSIAKAPTGHNSPSGSRVTATNSNARLSDARLAENNASRKFVDDDTGNMYAIVDQTTGLGTSSEWIKNSDDDEQFCMPVRNLKLSDTPQKRAWNCEMTVVRDRPLAIVACAYLQAKDRKLIRADICLRNTTDATRDAFRRSYLLFPGCSSFREEAAAKGAEIKDDEEIDYGIRLLMGPDEKKFEWCLRMEQSQCVLFRRRDSKKLESLEDILKFDQYELTFQFVESKRPDEPLDEQPDDCYNGFYDYDPPESGKPWHTISTWAIPYTASEIDEVVQPLSKGDRKLHQFTVCFKPSNQNGKCPQSLNTKVDQKNRRGRPPGSRNTRNTPKSSLNATSKYGRPIRRRVLSPDPPTFSTQASKSSEQSPERVQSEDNYDPSLYDPPESTKRKNHRSGKNANKTATQKTKHSANREAPRQAGAMSSPTTVPSGENNTDLAKTPDPSIRPLSPASTLESHSQRSAGRHDTQVSDHMHTVTRDNLVDLTAVDPGADPSTIDPSASEITEECSIIKEEDVELEILGVRDVQTERELEDLVDREKEYELQQEELKVARRKLEIMEEGLRLKRRGQELEKERRDILRRKQNTQQVKSESRSKSNGLRE